MTDTTTQDIQDQDIQSQDQDQDQDIQDQDRDQELFQDAPSSAPKDIRIPKARFDEVVAKAREREKALLAELEALKAQHAQQAQSDKQLVDELAEHEARYEQLVFNGDAEAAKEVRQKIQQLRQQVIEQQLQSRLDSVRRSVLEEVTYNTLLSQLETQYSQINPDSPEFDEGLTREMAVLVAGFVQGGLPKHEALQRAARYVLRSSGDVAAARRTQQARDKAAKANKAQPPPTAGLHGASGPSEIVDGSELTLDTLAKLDAATLAKLRGDLI